MRRGLRFGFRRRYGASPLHLSAHLVVFAIVAVAVDRIVSGGDVKELLMWYLGFAIAHDLVFVPAYTGLDRLFRATIARLVFRLERPSSHSLRAQLVADHGGAVPRVRARLCGASCTCARAPGPLTSVRKTLQPRAPT